MSVEDGPGRKIGLVLEIQSRWLNLKVECNHILSELIRNDSRVQ